jgi:allophanate hydrolase
VNWLTLDIASLESAYLAGTVRPAEVVREFADSHWPQVYQSVWISRFSSDDLLARAAAIEHEAGIKGIGSLPLYGVLVAVKDNIDVAGLPTTAACPAFSYVPERSATAVQLLEQAGAIIVGKTNLDQFATGLVGVRSPYGEVANAFDPQYISGGSSSGSAVAVALGQVHLALGTDTAGSGRVPAALNNLVGLKPTPGVISTSGVVPACRSIDCVSILARTVADAALALSVMSTRNDSANARRPEWSTLPSAGPFRVAVPNPATLEFFGDDVAQQAFADALENLASVGAVLHEIDFSPFLQAAGLLYDGPFVAERLEAAGELLKTQPETIDPAVAAVIRKGDDYSAREAFAAQHQIALLRRQAAAILQGCDALVVPSIPAIYTRAAVNADPITLNSRLGTYTNAVNLLDLCALAVPTGLRSDRMPAGITLIAPALHDMRIARLAQRLQDALQLPLGATVQPYPAAPAMLPQDTASVRVAVVGAHLSGMPLNGQLQERGARRVGATRTAAEYRLYHLKDTVPPKPGLIHVAQDGVAIELEVWEMPVREFGSFVALIPAPLGIGSVALEDGSTVKGFNCDPLAVAGAKDITEFGGWRKYIASRR